jgi:hypothetical protein
MVFTRLPNGNMQCTINEIVPYVGIGLHSGRPTAAFSSYAPMFLQSTQ